MSERSRVLVAGCSGLSTGELTIVLDWVRRCSRPIDLTLLVPATLAPQVAWAGDVVTYEAGGGPPAVAAMAAALDACRPDLFVVADLLLYHAAPHELGASLEPLLDHALQRCPVAALDLYDWDLRAPILECYGAARFASAPPLPSALGRLLPSPYLVPRRSTPGRGRFAMLSDSRPLGADERARVRRDLGVGGKLVLTLTSPWQHAAQSLPDARLVTRRFPALMLRLLDEASARVGDVTLVHLGPAGINVPEDVRRVRYRHVAQMAPEAFRRLLGASDLVLTANCIASSVVRAASMRVPAAALRLGAPVEQVPPGLDGTPAQRALRAFLDDTCPAYGFLVWPLGLREAMLSILAGNPFEGIQEHLDVLSPDATVEGMARLLLDQAAGDRLRDAQARYFATLEADADDPDTALQAVLG